MRFLCALKESSVQRMSTPWDAVQSPLTLRCQTSSASAWGRAAQPPDTGSFPWACLQLYHLTSLTLHLGLSSTDSIIIFELESDVFVSTETEITSNVNISVINNSYHLYTEE